MRANELMIGNYVRIGDNNKYSGAIGKIVSLQYHQEEDGAYFNVFIRGSKGILTVEVFNEDLYPIELNDNILRNNFEPIDIHGYYDYRLCEKGKPDMWRLWTNPNYGYIAGTLVIDEFGGGIYEPCVPIRYVHELQNFLTLLKIKTEIILTDD